MFDTTSTNPPIVISGRKEELDAAQVRYNTVKLLRRTFDTHGRPSSILRAAEDVIEQYPALGADGGYFA